MTIGERISDLIRYNGMSQREFARRAGVTEATVCRWVNGSREPRLSMLRRIADALDVSVGDLMVVYYDGEL